MQQIATQQYWVWVKTRCLLEGCNAEFMYSVLNHARPGMRIMIVRVISIDWQQVCQKSMYSMQVVMIQVQKSFGLAAAAVPPLLLDFSIKPAECCSGLLGLDYLRKNTLP